MCIPPHNSLRAPSFSSPFLFLRFLSLSLSIHYTFSSILEANSNDDSSDICIVIFTLSDTLKMLAAIKENYNYNYHYYYIILTAYN